MYFNTDPIYWGIALLSMVLSGIASMMLRGQYARGQQIPIASGLSGREVAERVLRDANISDVQIAEHEGFLSDHYNPMTKTLALSPEVYHGTTAASAGVAAHEVGHAIQHARNYGPLWLRTLLVPPMSIGSTVGPALIAVGMLLGGFHGHGIGHTLAIAGVVLFAATTVFALVTVPVEFNASARAKERLVALGITRSGEEDHAVRGVLMAAGMTYVAGAVTSIMYLLYYIDRLSNPGQEE